MKKRVFPVVAVFISAAFLSMSCQQFFTTSVAATLARDPASLVPAVSSTNAAELAAAVSDDPDASLVVLSGLEDLIAAAPAEEQAELAALALDVASNASGVGGALLTTVDSLAGILTGGDLSDPETLDGLFTTIDEAIAGLGNLGDTSTSLVAILSGTTATIDDIAETATAEELAMAAIVLLSANAQNDAGGVAGYVGGLDPNSSSLSASEQLAVDLAAAAAAKYDAEGGTGPLASILSSLNLTGA